MNALQIDVEPWYADLPIDEWDNHDESVAELTLEIADIVEEHGNRATFFILGEVAERYPDVVSELYSRGHEIGSHGWWHTHLTELDRERFREGVESSLEALERAGVSDIDGYRAPQFSVEHDSRWALRFLDDLGFAYDSSVFPVQTPLYGVPDAPVKPYNIDYETLQRGDSTNLTEVPPSAFKLPVRNFPIAGGFFLRALPYPILRRALQRVERNRDCVCYLHPWEINPDVPAIDEYDWYYYFNLDKCKRKFARLNEDFEFGTTKQSLDSL